MHWFALAWVEKLAVLAANASVGICNAGIRPCVRFCRRSLVSRPQLLTKPYSKIANKRRLGNLPILRKPLINDFRGQLRDLLLSHFPVNDTKRPALVPTIPGSQLWALPRNTVPSGTWSCRCTGHPTSRLPTLSWLPVFPGSFAQTPGASGCCCLQARPLLHFNRLSLMNSDTASCFEYDRTLERIYAVRPYSQAELFTRPVSELNWPDTDVCQPDWSQKSFALAPSALTLATGKLRLPTPSRAALCFTACREIRN